MSCQNKTIEVPFESIYASDEITKIEVVNGNNGEHKTITNSENINSWIDKVRKIKFVRDENQEERAKVLLYPYSLKAYHDDKEIGDFTVLKFKGIYYEGNPEFNKQVEELFE